MWEPPRLSGGIQGGDPLIPHTPSSPPKTRSTDSGHRDPDEVVGAPASHKLLCFVSVGAARHDLPGSRTVHGPRTYRKPGQAPSGSHIIGAFEAVEELALEDGVATRCLGQPISGKNVVATDHSHHVVHAVSEIIRDAAQPVPG